MDLQPIASARFSEYGDYLGRLRRSLQVVVRQARLAQSAGYGRNVADALAETEAASQLARLDAALHDDGAEAEELGLAEQRHRASYPVHQAA
jgi:hypothetical protein